jgi:hypothetical protein
VFIPHVADQNGGLFDGQGLLETHRAPIAAALKRFDARAKVDCKISGSGRPQHERGQEE